MSTEINFSAGNQTLERTPLLRVDQKKSVSKPEQVFADHHNLFLCFLSLRDSAHFSACSKFMRASHKAAVAKNAAVAKKMQIAFSHHRGPYAVLSSYLRMPEQAGLSVINQHNLRICRGLKSDELRSIENMSSFGRLNSDNQITKIEDPERFLSTLCDRKFSDTQKVVEIYRKIYRQMFPMYAGKIQSEVNSIETFKKSQYLDYPEKKAEGDLHFSNIFIKELEKSDPNHSLVVAIRTYKNSTVLDSVKKQANKINQIIINYLQENPDFVQICENFNLSNKRLTTLPFWLRHINFRSIDFANNSISYFPGDLFNTSKLLAFYMRNNPIEELSRRFSPTKLQIFSMRDCALKETPSFLNDTRSLLNLDISSNEIKEIPKGVLQKAIDLRVVKMSGNKITKLESDHPFLQVIKRVYENRLMHGNIIFYPENTLTTHGFQPNIFDSRDLLPLSFKIRNIKKIGCSELIATIEDTPYSKLYFTGALIASTAFSLFTLATN